MSGRRRRGQQRFRDAGFGQLGLSSVLRLQGAFRGEWGFRLCYFGAAFHSSTLGLWGFDFCDLYGCFKKYLCRVYVEGIKLSGILMATMQTISRYRVFAYRQSTPCVARALVEIRPSLHSPYSRLHNSLLSPVQRARSSASFQRPTKPPSKHLGVGEHGLVSCYIVDS